MKGTSRCYQACYGMTCLRSGTHDRPITRGGGVPHLPNTVTLAHRYSDRLQRTDSQCRLKQVPLTAHGK